MHIQSDEVESPYSDFMTIKICFKYLNLNSNILDYFWESIFMTLPRLYDVEILCNIYNK